MSNAPYPTLTLKPDRSKNLLQGHPWIFSGAVAQKPKAPDGALVRVESPEGFLGIGFWNSALDIAVRIITRKDISIDEKYFRETFRNLARQRILFLPHDTNAYRLAFAEADGLPGLVVDRYADAIVFQIHTLGMDGLRKEIIAALDGEFQPRLLIERSDLGVRKLEGCTDSPKTQHKGVLEGHITILENGFKFKVDPWMGQKTGFFLDQRENRLAVQRWAKDRRVLNLFSYSGGFSVHAAAAKAKHVISVDASRSAIALCEENFSLNGFIADPSQFIVADAFEYLEASKPDTFDLMIIDPPSFAKQRNQMPKAIAAYARLHTEALRRLPNGGILIASSCTAHIDPLTFIKILHQSAADANCRLHLLESKEQPFDHPYALSFPEGRYLKFMVLQKQEIH